MDKLAVLLAFHEAKAHPAVKAINLPVFEARTAHIEFDLEVGLPSRWEANGVAPGEVLAIERVRLTFADTYPLSAPQPSLRSDFNLDRPHIARGYDGLIVPCVVDGDDAEFIASRGIYGYIGQIRDWLKKAAAGQLLGEEFGWEPMLHPFADDQLVIDSGQLRAKVTDQGGFAFLDCLYVFSTIQEGGRGRPLIFAQTDQFIAPAKAVFRLQPNATKPGDGYGLGAAIFVWPGRGPDGALITDSVFRADDVRDQPGLMRRAEVFGVKDSLLAALQLAGARGAQATPILHEIPIIMAARRPQRLQNTDSPIELSAYVLRKSIPVAADIGVVGHVRQLALREAMSSGLFKRMADETSEGLSWVLAGCGSLGSKIALHRARSGTGPSIVADPQSLKPHNAARHGLYPTANANHLGWHEPKAEALAQALAGLRQPCRSLVGGCSVLLAEIKKSDAEDQPTWLLNATASLIVRETLARGSAPRPRTIEVGLFSKGQLGYLTVEGKDSNPNGLELAGLLTEAARGDQTVGDHLFASGDNLQRIAVGEGCSSVTMKVADASLSVMAAAMAEIFGAVDNQSDTGAVHSLVRDGVGLAHQVRPAPPFTRLTLEGLEGWEISLSAEVVEALRAERAAYPVVETGGVLLGSCSMISRRIVVTSLYPAPPDSTRTETQFDLGVAGLRDGLEAIADASAGLLVCVGTWHSHLGSAQPSGMDRGSAVVVGLAEARPMAFAIIGADGLRAISASAVMSVPQTARKRGRSK